MKILDLRVEYLHNPIGVDFVQPRFSWKLVDGIRQTAYQILAISDEGEILWDSGKVFSSQMHLVVWSGKELTSRVCVNWTVTVWDENDKAETSERATFELGLLKSADWSAKWITGDSYQRKTVDIPLIAFVKRS